MKFLSCGKQKRYKKLLVSSVSMSGMDEIATQDEYKNALKGDMDLYKKIVKLAELNELANEDCSLSINTSFSISKVTFGLVRNVKNENFPEGNCKIV